jgi:glycosyltransferase involved in cell wall biosynthesis
MRITFVLPTLHLNGGERVVAAHARQLHKWGHKVTVVAAGDPPRRLSSWFTTLLGERRWPLAPVQSDPSFIQDAPCDLHFIPFGQSILDYAPLPDADVIVATWWETAEWVASLPDCKGAKFYFIQGHDVHIGRPNVRIRATYRLRMKKIVVSQWLQNIMSTEYGDNDVALVPNAVDTELFRAPPRSKQRDLTVGYMYSTATVKGSDLAYRAMQIARRYHPHLCVYAFGRRDPTRQLPLPTKTHFVRRPNQALLPQIYSRCDAWLFPSRPEGFGLPILEAMACRTPVIATPVGAAPQLLAQGGGILVEPESPEALAEAIDHIARFDNTQWWRMSNLAHQTATNYSWKNATTRLVSVFEEACHGTQCREEIWQ